MDSLGDVLNRIETITFDCYGTLIDWRAGVESSLRAAFGDAIVDGTPNIFDDYVRIEAHAEVEAGSYRSYREVLAIVAERLAERYELPISPEQAAVMAERLPRWTPFADTNEALRRLKQRYRLGVLSNIDRDLFAGTAPHFDITFDFVITAEDVRSYKPALPHFDCLLELYPARASILHVAQSLYHDGRAANSLDLAYVWINRYNETNDGDCRPLAAFPDLKSLADVACA